MALNRTDITFNKILGKRFTSPNKQIYQEKSEKTININSGEIWSDSINISPSQAVLDLVAEKYTLQVLTPDPINATTTFYFMITIDSFIAGMDDYETGILNNALRKDFISDKYGAAYEVLLYSNDNILISKTDPITWYFDYESGVLYVQNPGIYATPYKITIHRYIGNYLDTITSSTSKFNITDKNLPALSTNLDNDKACNTPISEIPNSGVRVYINGQFVESGSTSLDFCYFSNDLGVTKKAIGTEEQGDILYWVGSIANYQLEITDSITFIYLTSN